MAQTTVEREQISEQVDETETEIARYDTVVNCDVRSQKEECTVAGPSKDNTKAAKIHEGMAQIAVEREQIIEVLVETETEKATCDTVVNLDEISEKEEGTAVWPLNVHTKEKALLNSKIGEEMAQTAVEIEEICEELKETETEKDGAVPHLDEMAITAVESEELIPDIVTPILKTLIMNIGLPTLNVRFIRLLFPDHWGCGLLVVAGILANFLFTALAW